MVLAATSDPYRPLAVDIASAEAAPLASTVQEAVRLAPDFLLWVVSPSMLSDAALIDYGKAVEDAGAPIALGFISGSSMARARALAERRLPGTLRIARVSGSAPTGTFHARPATIEYGGGAPPRVVRLTIDSFREALRQTDALSYEGHGAETWLNFDGEATFTAQQLPASTPGLVSTFACNTFRIWTPRSIALGFADRGTAAYVGYSYSPLPGYQITNGFPLGDTWPEFPIGRLVELQSAASMRGLFAVPAYHLLGDPRLSVRDTPPYTVISDGEDANERVIELASQSDAITPVRIEGGAAYETTEVAGVARVWRRDPFYNGRLQVLDVGADRYLLVQHPSARVSIRLTNDRPMIATAAGALLKGLDLCFVVFPGADRTSCAAATAFGIVGLSWMALRRRAGARLRAIAIGGVVGAAHLVFATARLGHVAAVSWPDTHASPLHPWMFSATWSLAAWGALCFFSARSRRGKWVGLAVAGLFNGWAPVLVWLAWPFVFNRMVVSRIGSPLYNYRTGLLTLAGAITFSLIIAAIFMVAHRGGAVDRSASGRPSVPLTA